jgi:hypothetical protein
MVAEKVVNEKGEIFFEAILKNGKKKIKSET